MSPGRPGGCHASHRASFAVSARPFGQRVSILTQGPACSIRKRMRRFVAPWPALPASQRYPKNLAGL
ncbi:TPA: hypothetical protein ACX1S2_004173 [Yersinia enterocolitica]